MFCCILQNSKNRRLPVKAYLAVLRYYLETEGTEDIPELTSLAPLIGWMKELNGVLSTTSCLKQSYQQ